MKQELHGNTHLQAVLNTVLDGLVMIDSRGAILSFNPAAERIFGYEAEEVIGQNVKMLMPDPYHSEHDDYIENYLNTGEKKVIGIGREVSARRKDGSVFPMELGINEMEVEGQRMFVGTIRDITERKQAENKIASDAARYETVLNTVLDGLVMIDRKGVIQSINPAAVRIFGYEAEEVVGQNVKMLMPDPYHSEHDGYLKNYLETGDKKVIGIGREVAARRKDGSVFPIELGVNEMEVDGQRMFVGTIRDITERKQAENKIASDAARYETVLNTVLDGLIMIDSRGAIRSFNPAAVRIFGYEAEEVIGQNVKMLMPDPYHSEHDGYLRNYLDTGEKKVIGIGREVSARRKDGSVFPMELGINETKVDEQRMFVGTIRDITERKEAEAAITEYVEKLRRSNQDLDDFAYIASHDLKEPLRGLGNNAIFLREDYEEKLDDEAKKRINRMTYLCERMERLVDDLLYFSRLGRQELAVQLTDLNDVIRDIEIMTEATLKEKKAKIVIPKPLPKLKCDLPRMTELYRNLITNAIKYNDKDEKIIEVGTQNLDGQRVFYVKDNGIGIEEKFFGDVFRIFKRLNDEEDTVKGTGVGLTFVKRIVERYRGRIWLESTPGEGTTFYFTMNTEAGQ